MTRFFAVVPSALLLSVSVIAQESPIPDVIGFAGPTKPLGVAWVAARVALDRNGELDPEYFAPDQLKFLAGQIAKNPDGNFTTCLMQPTTHTQDRTWPELAANAKIIVSGEVLGSAVGFHTGKPATLVALHVTERIRKKADFTQSDVVYIALPSAKVITAHGGICTTMAGQPLDALEPGDRVLLFAFYRPIDETRAIFDVTPGRNLLVERSGALIPNALAIELGRAVRFDQVAAWVLAND